MSKTKEKARAGGVALLLLVAGMALGIVIDRVALVPAPANASPLTVESLAERIDLPPEDADRLRALLDTLHADVMAATGEGPEALRGATETAHERLEAALDPEVRPEFRAWLEEHRERMMRHMHAEMMGGRGMMRGF